MNSVAGLVPQSGTSPVFSSEVERPQPTDQPNKGLRHKNPPVPETKLRDQWFG